MLLWREVCWRTEDNSPLGQSHPPPWMFLCQCRGSVDTEDWTIFCQSTQTSSLLWETNMNGRVGNKSHQEATDTELSFITPSKFPNKWRMQTTSKISLSHRAKRAAFWYSGNTRYWFSSLKWQWWKYCDFFSVRRGNYYFGEDKGSWSDGCMLVTVSKGSDGNFRKKYTAQCFLNH